VYELLSPGCLRHVLHRQIRCARVRGAGFGLTSYKRLLTSKNNLKNSLAIGREFSRLAQLDQYANPRQSGMRQLQSAHDHQLLCELFFVRRCQEIGVKSLAQ
jgi:hypothetical protein